MQWIEKIWDSRVWGNLLIRPRLGRGKGQRPGASMPVLLDERGIAKYKPKKKKSSAAKATWVIFWLVVSVLTASTLYEFAILE